LTDLSFISDLSHDIILDFTHDHSLGIESDIVIDAAYDDAVDPVSDMISTLQPDLASDIHID
jgi:hypothetical protein